MSVTKTTGITTYTIVVDEEQYGKLVDSLKNWLHYWPFSPATITRALLAELEAAR